MVQPVKILWYFQIFWNNTLWPLSNCLPPKTWLIWAKDSTGISDVIGNNRAIIKAFSAYHLFELLIIRMSHTRLHIM